VDVVPPIPLAMEIARFLAPVLLGYAVFRGILVLFRQQLQLVGLRVLVRNHVVVAGLGEKGFRLAAAFREEGFRVVAIEIDEDNGSIQGAKERGISVLSGDARDPRMLAKARVGRARYLAAVCGDDGRNVEVEVAAAGLAAGRGEGELHALVHLDDAGLWRMLSAESISHHTPGVRVEFFNVFETGARMLLAERPPPGLAPRDPDSLRRVHVLLAGVEGIGYALVLHLARLWQASRPQPGESLRVTILDEAAEDHVARLVARYPRLDEICDLRAVGAILGVELQRGPLDIDVEPGHAVSAGYICIADEARGLEVALALRARPEFAAVPFAVAVNDARAGLAKILHDDPQTAHGVYAFGVLNRTLRVLPLVLGTNEMLAAAKHDEYVRHQRARGETMGEGVLVPWDQLPEQWKETNRAFADGIGAKLAATGAVLVPALLIDPNAPLFAFSAEEVEELARLEHERWVADKLRSGWRHGPERDDTRKIHPLLVDWDQLPESERDKDREPVREVPTMLARTGFEILRGGPPPPAQPPSPSSKAPLTAASKPLSR
jgi:hypothetical protein